MLFQHSLSMASSPSITSPSNPFFVFPGSGLLYLLWQRMFCRNGWCFFPPLSMILPIGGRPGALEGIYFASTPRSSRFVCRICCERCSIPRSNSETIRLTLLRIQASIFSSPRGPLLRCFLQHLVCRWVVSGIFVFSTPQTAGAG